MAKEPGEMFRCDRAEHAHANGRKTAVFMNEYDEARNDWELIEWRDTHGVLIKTLLCPECLETYHKITADQRAQTQAFMYERLEG